MEKDNKNIKSESSKEENLSNETSEEETSTEEEVTVDETPAGETSAEEATVDKTSEEEVTVDETPVGETSAEEAVNNDKKSLDVPFIIGRKVGMTRLFDDEGKSYSVTLVEAGPCYITQIKSNDKDGYSSVQIGYSEFPEKKLNKPQLGHLKTLKDKYLKYLKEYKINDISEDISIGGEINVGLFDIGDFVNISGVSKGKGFAGHMKRHGFSGGRASHGKNSVMRKAGSIGAGSDPSKVWKGTKMAGRMGNEKVTIKNLEVIKINNDENTIFLSGSVPGAKNCIVYISKVS